MKKTIIILSTTVTIIFLILGILTITISDTSAKYSNYQELNHYYSSNKLYISSNGLDKKNKYNVINYYNYELIDIEINNSLSSEQITNYDINYTLTCNVIGEAASNYQCLFDNKETNSIQTNLDSEYTCKEDSTLNKEECLKQNYTVSYHEKNNLHKFKLSKLSANTPDNSTVEVELILTTTSPFTQTLKGTYIFNITSEKTNEIELTKTYDTDNLCEYEIINKYFNDKKVKVKFNTSSIIIDETSEVYQNKLSQTTDTNNYIDSITINIKNNTSLKIRFYKRNFEQKCDNSKITYTEIQ